MRKILIIAILFLSLLLPASPVLAIDPDSDTVNVAAVPYIESGILTFTVTYVNSQQVDLEWTLGADVVNVMVRAKYGSIPISRTDGYNVYEGTDLSCTDTSMDFEETASVLYYRVWAQTTSGDWIEYEINTGETEGLAMTTIAIVILILGLTILAFWKHSAVLYMVDVIGWLFLSFYVANIELPTGNTYLGYAITGFCLAVALILAVQVYRVYDSTKITPISYQERQEKYKQKVYGITKKKKPANYVPWYEDGEKW